MPTAITKHYTKPLFYVIAGLPELSQSTARRALSCICLYLLLTVLVPPPLSWLQLQASHSVTSLKAANSCSLCYNSLHFNPFRSWNSKGKTLILSEEVYIKSGGIFPPLIVKKTEPQTKSWLLNYFFPGYCYLEIYRLQAPLWQGGRNLVILKGTFQPKAHYNSIPWGLILGPG